MVLIKIIIIKEIFKKFKHTDLNAQLISNLRKKKENFINLGGKKDKRKKLCTTVLYGNRPYFQINLTNININNKSKNLHIECRLMCCIIGVPLL